MRPSLWNSLEILSTEAALLVEWREALGEDFATALQFLQPTPKQADSYPCIQPNPCGCRHRVIFESEDDVCAVCDCHEAGCDVISLPAEDLITHALNGPLLAAAIRRALQFNELLDAGPAESRSRLVGSWGVRRSRVFFYVPINENGFLTEIDKLSSAMPEPFVLLTPTSRFRTSMVHRSLRRQGNAQLSLAGILALSKSGQLELLPGAKATVEAMLEDFAKRIAEGTPLERAIARVEEKLNAIAKSRSPAENDAVSEEAARGALEIVKKLDTGSRTRKATLLTVFRLYCIKGMSSRQIANDCGCSRAMVTKRLKFLEEKLGMSPAKLRTYSAQFERMEDELTDSRARRVDRWKLAHDNQDDEDQTA